MRPVFFRVDAEQMHDQMTLLGYRLGRNSMARLLTRTTLNYHHPLLEQTVAGIRFANPVGLAAGFDKEARLVDIIPDVGFGYMEVGSVTGTQCPGNPKPRLWRLPASRALVVNFGLKSDGADVVAARLTHRVFRFPVGISIAKANLASFDTVDAGIADYVRAAIRLAPIATYITINISCPNTTGGEPFTEPHNLDRLLNALDAVLQNRPAFIKLPAQLSSEEVTNILFVARRHHVTGFICTNLSKDRSSLAIRDPVVPPRGGISGKVVEANANAVLRKVATQAKNEFVLIGVGGIFSAEDAYEKIRLGASLVQLITGMIYCGPQLIREINEGLVHLLQRDGYSTISEAIGADI